jgi:hypothetical protein
MTTTSIQVQLPSGFTSDHERAVIDYLADRLFGREAWAKAFEAFDLLDQAVLVTAGGRYTFRTLYQQMVDRRMADVYLGELLALHDVKEQSPTLWSHFARQIVSEFTQRGWQRSDVSETRLLLSYLLYWWGAFARGYAFEVEVFRDLRDSGIQFQAHDLLDRQQRYSPSDLAISGMAGDIKTSIYFVQAAGSLVHDFYITRLFTRGRAHTLAVLLQSPIWDIINGDPVPGHLDTVVEQLPAPIRIQHRGRELVVMGYDEWKKRILHLQGEAQ